MDDEEITLDDFIDADIDNNGSLTPVVEQVFDAMREEDDGSYRSNEEWCKLYNKTAEGMGLPADA